MTNSEMMRWLGDQGVFSAVQAEINASRPELVERVGMDSTHPMLRINCGAGTSVGLARSQVRYMAVWCIAGPQSGDATSCWPVGTPPKALARQMMAKFDAWNTGLPTESPWRWDEPKRSALTDLADGLSAAGLKVDTVVGSNRYERVAGSMWTDPPRLASAEGGDWLRLTAGDEVLRISLLPRLGWTLDLLDSGQVRRVDLGQLLTGLPSRGPGIPASEVAPAALADAVAKALSEGPLAASEAALRPNAALPSDRVIDGPCAAADGAAAWTRWLGFSDAAARHAGPVPSVLSAGAAVYLDGPRSRPIGRARVQQIVGTTPVRDKRSLLFSVARYTRDSGAWADTAGVALFAVDQLSGRIVADSSLAREMIPRGER